VRWEWALVTGPAIEPLGVDEAKLQARSTHAREDRLMYAWISAARHEFEQYTQRAATTQTWKLQLSDWPERVALPMASPLQSASVQYYNAAGTLTTLASSAYVVDTTSEPGELSRAPNQAWPALQSDRLFRVVITYIAGWSSQAAIPEVVRLGMKLYVTAQDMDRAGSTADAKAARAAAQSCWAPWIRTCKPPAWSC